MLKSLVHISNISFKDAIEILKAGKSSENKEEEANELLALLGNDFEIDFNVNDEEGILYYIAGFLSKSELKGYLVHLINVCLQSLVIHQKCILMKILVKA